MKKCQWRCDLSQVEAMYYRLARNVRHDQTWIPRTSTGHIVSNRLWHQVAKNHASHRQGLRLVCDRHRKFVHQLVHIASQH